MATVTAKACVALVHDCAHSAGQPTAAATVFEVDLTDEANSAVAHALKDYVTRIMERSDSDKAVREWARANGYPVSERGRIPEKLRLEFQEAHRQSCTPSSNVIRLPRGKK